MVSLTSFPLVVATPPAQSAHLCDHTGAPLGINDLVDFTGYIAEHDAPKASLDWDDFSHPVELVNYQAQALLSPNGPMPVKGLQDYLFLLDTGATCHISPECSDFKELKPIPPHPVKGLGGASIYAIGLGTIELVVSSGKHLILHNVLFVPASSVRLISVITLNQDGDYVSHFDSKSCWVTNRAGAVLAQGLIAPHRKLYTLTSFVPSVAHLSSVALHPAPDTALYATCVPDLKTWHRRLGHSNLRNIIDMARTNAVKGM